VKVLGLERHLGRTKNIDIIELFSEFRTVWSWRC